MASKFKQTKVAAVVGKPNADADRIKFYTAEIPADVVASFQVERALDMGNEGGFQRPFDKARAKQIGVLMGGDKKKKQAPKPHAHGGLLAYALDGEVAYAPSTGTLTIRRPLHLLDGQTRAGGAAWAVDNGETADYTETVRVIEGATPEEIVNWYLVANMTQRKAPPQNMLLNIAKLAGTTHHRKSWVARLMMSLATAEPFTLQRNGEFHRIVSFMTRDGGQLSAYSLYKAINFMLPDDLNREGDTVEKKALKYTRDAFRFYATLYPEWGETDENGKLKPHDAYEFTLLAAFARLYKGVKASNVNDVFDTIRRAWIESGYDNGLPEEAGSGERAALALASYAASKAGIGPLRESVAA